LFPDSILTAIKIVPSNETISQIPLVETLVPSKCDTTPPTKSNFLMSPVAQTNLSSLVVPLRFKKREADSNILVPSKKVFVSQAASPWKRGLCVATKRDENQPVRSCQSSPIPKPETFKSSFERLPSSPSSAERRPLAGLLQHKNGFKLNEPWECPSFGKRNGTQLGSPYNRIVLDLEDDLEALYSPPSQISGPVLGRKKDVPEYRREGLQNNGNTCYQNAVLACLLSLKSFVQEFQFCKSMAIKAPLHGTLSELIQRREKNKNSVVDPKEFNRWFTSKDQKFLKGRQEVRTPFAIRVEK
jgi:hypothetical protein